MKEKSERNRKEIRALELFGTAEAAFAAVLCVLFLLDVFPAHGILNFILIAAVLLNASLLLWSLLKHRTVLTALAVCLMLGYLFSFVYYNLL